MDAPTPFWRCCEECGKPKFPKNMHHYLTKHFCDADCQNKWIKKLRAVNAKVTRPI